MKTNRINLQLDYTIISEKQAQQEHESLAHSERVGSGHKSKSYKDCDACKRRFKQMKVKVIK